MSKSLAEKRANELAEEIRARGAKVLVSLLQGRPGTPNDRWYDTRFIGSMGHHIVSSRSQGLTPGYSLVRQGRSDVPGPLANGYGGFDLVARIICMGWANHPGAGGPLTLPGGTIPRDTARPYLFGWEHEGGVNEADWTSEMREFMGICHAGTLAWLKRSETSHVEHKTWAPTRKIDRLNYTLAKARNELKPHLAISSGESVSTMKWSDRLPWSNNWITKRWPSLVENYKDGYMARSLIIAAYAYGRKIDEIIRSKAWQEELAKVFWNRVNPTTGTGYGAILRKLEQTVLEGFPQLAQDNAETKALLHLLIEQRFPELVQAVQDSRGNINLGGQYRVILEQVGEPAEDTPLELVEGEIVEEEEL